MGRELVAGAKAPAFTLPRDGGGNVSLKDFKGGNLVLYFYPKADTPGCTKEAIAFSRLRADFSKADTAILGVSADPVAAQDKFKAKHKFAIALASDETKSDARSLWGLGREIDVRAQIHGGHPQDLSDRRGRTHCPDLAESARTRPRRRGFGTPSGASNSRQILGNYEHTPGHLPVS